MSSALLESPWLRTPLVVIAVLALQTGLVAEIRILGVSPDLMLLIAVAAGLVTDPERGAFVGFLVGLAFDLVVQTPFGLSALAYAVAAFAVGYIRLSALKAGWWIPMLSVALASAVGVVVFALVGALFGMAGVLTYHLLTIVLVVSIANGLLAPPAVMVMRWCLASGDRARVR